MASNNLTQAAAISLRGCRCRAQQSVTKGRSCCIEITKIEKPDPATYSQDEQFSLGVVPTWNSPDILTNNISPFTLLPEASITVRNQSNVSASNVLVHILTSPFGIGTQKTLELSQKIHLAGNQAVQLTYPFSQARLKGDQRIGIHILLEHPYDSKPINNAGSQAILANYTSQAGRTQTHPIPILNDSAFAQTIQLQILATDVLASISPSMQTYAPYEQIVAHLSITVPAFLTGSSSSVVNREVTVIGRRADGSIVGGMTLILYIDN